MSTKADANVDRVQPCCTFKASADWRWHSSQSEQGIKVNESWRIVLRRRRMDVYARFFIILCITQLAVEHICCCWRTVGASAYVYVGCRRKRYKISFTYQIARRRAYLAPFSPLLWQMDVISRPNPRGRVITRNKDRLYRVLLSSCARARVNKVSFPWPLRRVIARTVPMCTQQIDLSHDHYMTFVISSYVIKQSVEVEKCRHSIRRNEKFCSAIMEIW